MIDIVFDGATAGMLRCFYASQGVFDLDRRVCKLEGCGCLFRGPIGGSFDDPRRREVMVELYSDEEPESRERALERWEGYLRRFRDCLAAAKAGEPVRIWYSNEPHSLCGFHEVIFNLFPLGADIRAVKLPEWSPTEEGKRLLGWGAVEPEDIPAYLPLEVSLSPAQQGTIAGEWERLRQENGPLQAQVNGRLVSVPEDFYLPFIRREVPEGPFRVCDLIVRVLNFHLGIGDGIVYDGIRAMIESGELEAVETAGRPYWTVVKRGPNFPGQG